MPQYAPVFELSGLDGDNGFRLNGVAARDYAGCAVSSAGDLNGDGFDDLIVGAKKADPNGNLLAGASYVVFGGPTLLGQLDAQDGVADGTMELASLAALGGANGFTIDGVAASDYSGFSVASAGDVNDDGFDDIVVGTKSAGRSYVVFGGAALLGQLDANDGSADGTIELSGLAAFGGANGFKISGDSNGASVASAGDINGDGFADVIVGAPGSSPNGQFSGASYVVFGKASGFSANLNVANLDGGNGFKIDGEAKYDNSGVSVSSAGDVNGDGVADLLVGSFRHPFEYDLGCTYLVFGKTSVWDAALDLSSLDGVNGYKLQGQVLGAHAGEHVASAGDVNGDGFADIIVGARDANAGADNAGAGATYVVFGGAAKLAALDLVDGAVDGDIGIHNVDGATGFRMDGEALGDYSGVSVSSAGDFNGDGFADLIVGAIHNDSPNGPGSGASYVVFGGTGLPASFGLASLDGDFGFKIAGEAGSYNGGSVSAAGDVNGDGFDDLIVGAYGAGAHGLFTGAAYVIYGAMPGEAVTRDGTAIANTIHGGDFDDALNGLDGKDTLYGHDGNDVLGGGRGKDRLTGGAGADVLKGGNGADRFIYQAASESTGSSYDTIKKADFLQDYFDVQGTIGGIDAMIGSGQLRGGQFDSDLAAAVDSSRLGANHAVLFTPDAGGAAGKTFLIVDLNGVAGYQTGQDLVISIADPRDLANLDIGDFL